MAYKTSEEYKKLIYDENSEHSMDILINDNVINNDYVTELTLDDQVFNSNEFSLGSAIPCKIELTLDNSLVNQITPIDSIEFNYKLIVNDKEEIVPLGTFNVVKMDNSSDESTKYTLYDLMKKLDAEWDASKYMPCTRYELYSHMCEDFNIKKGSSSFINGNVMMNVYDSEYKARDYLIYISERAGGFGKIIRDSLYIRSLGEVDKTIISDEIIGEYIIDNKKIITKVVYANATQRFEKGTDEGVTIYLSQNNPLSCTQEEVDNIYNSLKGLEYQSLEIDIWGDPSIDTGDIIKIGNFISFAQKSWTFGNGFYGSYKTNLKEITSGVNTQKESVKAKLRRFQSTINEVEGKISLLAENVEDLDKEIVTKKNANGNPIEVDDAGEYPLESIAIDGKSYQETTTGKNLFPTLLQGTAVKGNITFTHHEEDDSYDVVGTATTTAYLSQIALRMTIDDSKIENGKYYSMSFNQEIPKDDMIIVAELYGSSGYLRGIVNSDYPCMQANLSNATYANFYIYVKPGKTVNIKRLKVQVEEGTVATAIESYTGGMPSPNSEYPQEIETVQGITNILDNNHYTDKANIGTSNGLDEPGINIIRFDAYNRCKENTYIYFSKILCAYFYDKNKNFISSVTDRSEKILTPKNTYYARFRTYSSEYTTFKNTDYVVSYTPNPSIIPSGRWLEQITYSKNNAIFDESYKSNSYTYNSFDADNISVVKNATGGIFYARYKLDIRKAGDYIISSESNINHQIYVYRDALWGSLVKWAYTGGESEITFEEAGTYILGVFANSSTAGAEFQIQNLMVRKKTIEDSSYAKYKMNSALIDMNKSNLFDSEIEVGALSGNDGTNAQVTIRLRSKKFIKLTSNHLCSLKYNEDNIKYNIFYYDKNKTYIFNLNSWLTNKDTFVVPNNVEYVRFVFHNSDYPNVNMQVSDISNIQLYEGYDPYYEFSSTNEVKDIFDNGNLIKKTNKVILTENDAWVLSPNYSNLFVMKNKPADLKMQEIDLVSSIGYKVVNNTGQINANDYCIYIGNDINIKCKDYTTLEEFKNYLKNNPITIFYPSTSPQIYELSYERLKLHKGYNYITLNDDLYPNMEIEYLTDSILNATYATHAELKIESDKISSEVAKKVSRNDLNEVIEDVNSTIEQKAESITSEINGKFANYSTTSQMNASIKSQVDAKEAVIIDQVNGKFENYSTTTEMNTEISRRVSDSESSIKLEVSGIYETKTGAQTKANTAQTNAINSANASTDNKLKNYSTTNQVDAKLELKVGRSENDQVVSMLNASAQEINLTSNRFSMKSDYSSISKNGIVDFKGGKIGGWDIFADHLSADTIIGNNLYRTYLQPVLKTHEKDTWIFSIQKGAKDAVNLNSIFNVLSNGDIKTVGNISAAGKMEITSSEKVNVFISLFNPSRGGDARFAMSPTGNYGIYDAAFSNWREYFSNDGSSNKWILPAFDDVSLDYFFTSESLFMFRPSKNGSTHLGGSKWRWIQLWAVNATSTSSDENDKRDMLEFIAKDDDFFDKLKPISFYRKKGDRRHFGFGAQTVEKALKEVGYTSQDFAGLCFDTKTKTVKNEEGKEVEVPILDENGNEELSYSLRYEEFISLNTWQIQKAKERISNLEDMVKSQQETIENLIKRIEKLEKIEEGGSN